MLTAGLLYSFIITVRVQWYVNADDGDTDFIENFKTTYGRQPGLGTANAYDSLRLLSMTIALKGLSSMPGLLLNGQI